MSTNKPTEADPATWCLVALQGIRDNNDDIETNHVDADEALLAYVRKTVPTPLANEIVAAYNAIEKWYA